MRNNDINKEIYPLKQMPELGVVPEYMLAQCIRKSRYGEPKTALKLEKLPVPSKLKPNEVLIYVMAAGVNYNGVWACRGLPVDLIRLFHNRGEQENFHIPGSDCSGIVW